MADYYQEQNYQRPGVIYCSQCGRQNKMSNRYCIYCGNPMNEGTGAGNPMDEGPGLGNPMNEGPGFGNPMNEGPGFGNPRHEEPGFGFGAQPTSRQGGVIGDLTEFCRSIPALIFYPELFMTSRSCP